MAFIPSPNWHPSGGSAYPRYHSVHTRKGLIEELDRVCSYLIRTLYPFCVTCGEQRAHLLTCSHFFSRRFLHIRFDLRNLTTQCWRCNVAHATDQRPYLAWLLRERGDEALSEISELRYSRFKVTDDDMRQLLETRRAELREASR